MWVCVCPTYTDTHTRVCSHTQLTREISWPVFKAWWDSKQPVVENVQQLPHWPCGTETKSFVTLFQVTNSPPATSSSHPLPLSPSPPLPPPPPTPPTHSQQWSIAGHLQLYSQTPTPQNEEEEAVWKVNLGLVPSPIWKPQAFNSISIWELCASKYMTLRWYHDTFGSDTWRPAPDGYSSQNSLEAIKSWK